MRSVDPSIEKDLLSFPCSFEIRVVGKQSANFGERIYSIIDRHLADTRIMDMSSRCSRRGKYLSVTYAIKAASREQLDSIYFDLNREPDVLMIL